MILPFCDTYDESEAKKRFSEFYAIGPILDTTKVQSYIEQNTIISQISPHGPRSFMKGFGVQSISVELLKHTFENFSTYVSRVGEDYEISAIAYEAYPPGKVCEVASDSTAFGSRGTQINGVLNIRWKNEKHDDWVIKWVRNIVGELREIERTVSEKEGKNSAGIVGYANFALPGDRAAEAFKGNLARAREVKTKWDPHQRFNKGLLN